MDVSRQAVAKWEMGESLPDLPNTVKLAALFEVSLDELVLKSMNESLPGARDKVMGVLEVSSSGQIHLPDEVMDLFDIHTGEDGAERKDPCDRPDFPKVTNSTHDSVETL